MKSINLGVRAVLLGLLVVAASFIPRRAAANDDVTSPRNADVSASGAKSVRIEAAGGSDGSGEAEFNNTGSIEAMAQAR